MPEIKGRKTQNQERENQMYTVWMEDDFVCEETQVFEGTLAACLEYIAEDESDGMYIVEPDGFTVYDETEKEAE